jgi:hypothetical protein
MVGGEKVYLTEDEEAALRSEWAANELRMAEQRKRIEIERKRRAALHVLEERALTEEMAKLDASQEVKDYAAALATLLQ